MVFPRESPGFFTEKSPFPRSSPQSAPENLQRLHRLDRSVRTRSTAFLNGGSVSKALSTFRME